MVDEERPILFVPVATTEPRLKLAKHSDTRLDNATFRFACFVVDLRFEFGGTARSFISHFANRLGLSLGHLEAVPQKPSERNFVKTRA